MSVTWDIMYQYGQEHVSISATSPSAAGADIIDGAEPLAAPARHKLATSSAPTHCGSEQVRPALSHTIGPSIIAWG